MRDARPFLAHHLRTRGDEHAATNGEALHRLARYVENLPSGDTRMAAIEATDALDYDNGGFVGGPESEGLISGYEGGEVPVRSQWLDEFSAAVARFWSS
jgi:hypothetical protein